MTRDEVFAIIDAVILRADDPNTLQFGTIGLGMTREQVIRNLGKPSNVINLGVKEILVYSKIKVALVDGKVTDGQ